jgi:hypothetical protein
MPHVLRISLDLLEILRILDRINTMAALGIIN